MKRRGFVYGGNLKMNVRYATIDDAGGTDKRRDGGNDGTDDTGTDDTGTNNS